MLLYHYSKDRYNFFITREFRVLRQLKKSFTQVIVIVSQKEQLDSLLVRLEGTLKKMERNVVVEYNEVDKIRIR